MFDKVPIYSERRISLGLPRSLQSHCPSPQFHFSLVLIRRILDSSLRHQWRWRWYYVSPRDYDASLFLTCSGPVIHSYLHLSLRYDGDEIKLHSNYTSFMVLSPLYREQAEFQGVDNQWDTEQALNHLRHPPVTTRWRGFWPFRLRWGPKWNFTAILAPFISLASRRGNADFIEVGSCQT